MYRDAVARATHFFANLQFAGFADTQAIAEVLRIGDTDLIGDPQRVAVQQAVTMRQQRFALTGKTVARLQFREVVLVFATTELRLIGGVCVQCDIAADRRRQ
ncbi:hypothetical protein SSTU70S_04030 [Stutzerimonas stutzeri]